MGGVLSRASHVPRVGRRRVGQRVRQSAHLRGSFVVVRVLACCITIPSRLLNRTHRAAQEGQTAISQDSHCSDVAAYHYNYSGTIGYKPLHCEALMVGEDYLQDRAQSVASARPQAQQHYCRSKSCLSCVERTCIGGGLTMFAHLVRMRATPSMLLGVSADALESAGGYLCWSIATVALVCRFLELVECVGPESQM